MQSARAHIFVEGRVQGVFYRAYTRNVATAHGLSGWVRNLRDGRVEAVFEGEVKAIEEAVRDCRKGPAGSTVTNILVTWEEYAGDLRGFEIRY